MPQKPLQIRNSTAEFLINELERNNSDGTSAGNRKIELIDTGQSPAGIEFYSWDFAYNKDKGFKLSVIINKEVKQTLTLKARSAQHSRQSC
jgi:ABC-type Fe3+ transport system substrate-binding protein